MDQNENTQARHVANEIRNLIFAGTFQPGDGLNEQALANRFNVSRTPVREALRMLITSGMVHQEPRKRARVARMSLDRIFETMEALSEVEACCARLAARQITNIERAKLVKVHENFCIMLSAEPRNVVEISKLNILFHETILECCHNSVLIEFARTLAMQVIGYRMQQVSQTGRLEKSAKEHGEILEALLSGHEEQTYALMKAHFDIVSNNVTEVINTYNSKVKT